MKSSISTQLPSEEFFVVRVDGHLNSSHRRFVDALRVGLQLRDQYPNHKVKVLSAFKQPGDKIELH